MTEYILVILLLSVIFVFMWTCRTSLEAFENMEMRPWFGYEPGRYGPGWGRKGCENIPPDSCMSI
jgi:hypothetical protein